MKINDMPSAMRMKMEQEESARRKNNSYRNIVQELKAVPYNLEVLGFNGVNTDMGKMCHFAAMFIEGIQGELTVRLDRERRMMLVLKSINEHIEELKDDEGDATVTAKMVIQAFKNFDEIYGPYDWNDVK